MTSSSGPFRRGNLRQRLYCLFLFSPGTCPPVSPPSVLAAAADMISWPPTAGWHWGFLPTFSAVCLRVFSSASGLWASLFAPHSCLLPASERLCLWPWSLLHSPALSFMGLLGPSPLMGLFSSVGSCYLSCLGCLCDFPDPGQDPPASFPLPRWWEPPFYPAGDASQPKPSRLKLQTAQWWGGPVYSFLCLCLGKPLGRKRPVCVILPPFSFQFNPLVCWEREQAFTCRRKEMKPQAVSSFVEDAGSRR